MIKLPPPKESNLRVVSPNGGEVWQKGSTYPIKWQSYTNDNVFVRINLTPAVADLGYFTRQLFSKTENDGVEYWTIPSDIKSGSYWMSVSLCRSDNDCFWNDWSDSYFKVYDSDYSGNKPPSINGVSGPTALKIGETGTWTVQASDPENGPLSYSVIWGDEQMMVSGGVAAPSAEAVQQTATFTHTYSTAGTYYPKFRVTDNAGQSNSTSLSVVVGGGWSGHDRFPVTFTKWW